MPGERRKNERLIVLLVIGCLAFNYPLLALFNRDGSFFGVPVLFLYLFMFWALFILLIAGVTERKSFPKPISLKLSGPGEKD